MLKYFILSISLLFILIAPTASAQVNVIRGPYLQKPTPTSIIIRWRTDVATDSRVQYGASPTTLSTNIDDAGSVTDHSIEITGLNPNTTYFYNVGTTVGALVGGNNDHRFETFPVSGTKQPVRAWVIGDFGKGNTEQGLVRDSYHNFPDKDDTDIWLWLGDNAYDSGTDAEYQDKVFDASKGYFNFFSWLPFYPTPGNHDYLSVAPPTANISPLLHAGPYYDIVDVPTLGEAGGEPSGTEAFYSYDIGNVHFVCANSEIGCLLGSTNDWIGTWPLVNPFASNFTTSPFTDWLHADLSQNEKRWTVVYFHQPPFTDGSHESGAFWEVYMQAMRENITPILYQYNVDLVMSGHSHVFERSYLIKDHADDPSTWNPATMLVDGSSGHDAIGEAYIKDLSQPNGEEGTVFVVCGNSASKDDNPTLQYPAHYYADGCDTCVGSFVLDIDTDTLRGRYLKASGAIGDDFTIYKFGTITATEDNIAADLIKFENFPNPFDHELNLSYELTHTQQVKFDLTSITGAKTWNLLNETQNPGPKQFKIDTHKMGLAAGSYFLRCMIGEQVFYKTVVKISTD